MSKLLLTTFYHKPKNSESEQFHKTIKTKIHLLVHNEEYLTNITIKGALNLYSILATNNRKWENPNEKKTFFSSSWLMNLAKWNSFSRNVDNDEKKFMWRFL